MECEVVDVELQQSMSREAGWVSLAGKRRQGRPPASFRVMLTKKIGLRDEGEGRAPRMLTRSSDFTGLIGSVRTTMLLVSRDVQPETSPPRQKPRSGKTLGPPKSRYFPAQGLTTTSRYGSARLPESISPRLHVLRIRSSFHLGGYIAENWLGIAVTGLWRTIQVPFCSNDLVQ